MPIPVLPGLTSWGEPEPDVAGAAARAWRSGGIVGLPTETVYGLAADAQDPDAVARVYRAKGRPADHPLIVHVQGAAALAGWSAGPNPVAEALAAAFWPGALTVIVARSERAGDYLTGGQPTVALRCPNHPVALACIGALVALSGDPARGVAAPSANRFGRVSPTRAADVVAEVGEQLDPARDLVIDGGRCEVGVESTIVDCTCDPPRVLRVGAISQAQVDEVLAGASPRLGHPATRQERPDSAARSVVAGPAGPDAGNPGRAPRAPGTLESHYAPAARVRLAAAAAVDQMHAGPGGGPVGLIAEAGVPTPAGWVRLLAAEDATQYAREVYRALRRADELGLSEVVAVPPDPHAGPLAEAVSDRLTRAAAARA